METETLKEEKEDLRSSISDLFQHSLDYLNTFYRLAVVRATEKATRAAAAVLSGLVTAVFGLFTLLFLFVGLALWLGDVVNSRAAGFFIVAGFFMLVIVGVVLMSKKIVFPYFRDRIIRKLYD
ncbi:MAG TPA: phage holin family protein [Chitinophagaceae bacterium]|nr:phage holin family protein [Chitinophagaceae bacterium]